MNVSLQSILDLMRDYAEANRVPEQEEIQDACDLIGWAECEWVNAKEPSGEKVIKGALLRARNANSILEMMGKMGC
jgi:hypothetical protein